MRNFADLLKTELSLLAYFKFYVDDEGYNYIEEAIMGCVSFTQGDAKTGLRIT
jgi:hypothetical protein